MSANFLKLTPEDQLNQPWWRTASSFFESHRLTEHQLDSYNVFMTEKLDSIITNAEFQYKKDNSTFIVNFNNVYVNKPQYTEPNGTTKKLYPYECRIRKLSYMCRIQVDIKKTQVDNEGKIIQVKTFPKVCIGSIPCMIRSIYCHLYNKDHVSMIKKYECAQDPGGYFIINGSEKVLMSQDRMAHNEIFVFECKKDHKIKFPKKNSDKNKLLPCSWSAEVRSHSNYHEPNITNTFIRLSAEQLEKGESSRLYIELPNFTSPVPWPIVFKALGVVETKDMVSYVCNENDTEIFNLLQPSLDCDEIRTQNEAIEFLSDYVLVSQVENKIAATKKVLRDKLLQNVPTQFMKVYYLGHMTFQLLSTVIGRRHEDDRDHYGKKRIESAGSLINNLFKSVWKRVIREAKTKLDKKRANHLAQIFSGKITNYIKPPFATGNWTAIKSANKPVKAGISQLLNRHNFVSTLSNLRRIITPTDKNSKIVKPRHLHSSQWAFICPSETPEGQTTGLIRNLSMLTTISLGTPQEDVINWLKQMKDVHVEQDLEKVQQLIYVNAKIFINGTWFGICKDPINVITELKELRKQGKISRETSISYTKEGIRVFTDEGRLLTPFFVVKNGKLIDLPEEFTWLDLFEKGIIEYIDPSELETLYHSEYPWKLDEKHTHAFIHPTFLQGVSASTIPFPDHNQSPRNIYQASMGKQALGVFAGNFLHRYDTNAHVLCYPQKPIVNTMTMRMIGSEKLPTGQNLIVAVMCAAYNQEDSVIINKRAIDNGALRSYCYTTYEESNSRKGNVWQEIRKPQKSVKETRIKGYTTLDEDGVAKEGTPLTKRDVIVGKVMNDGCRDTSVIIKCNGMLDDSVIENQDEYVINTIGSSSIDKSLLTTNEDSFKTVQVRVRQYRIPQIGDKVASRSAQKGIIGNIVPPENMPFSSKTGMSPDLIMNPNAFPSRMTVSQALESVLGKACSLNGAYADCSPFDPNMSAHVIAQELEKHGFDKYGDEEMINGMTGEKIKCTIFMGPTYYQRLKHMVDDKIHSRDQHGARETLTRQPVEGRKRGGGFKMGEMETWCGISHGASNFLIDRLVNNSDGYEMFVCDLCGNAAIATLKTKRFECKRCQQNVAISKIRIPYAFKLLQQELQAMCIGVWFNVDTTKKLLPATTPSH